MRSNRLIIVMFFLLLGVVLGQTLPALFRAESVTASEPREVTPRSDLGADELRTIALFRDASPSVVNIITRRAARDRFTMDVTEIPAGSGTGFMWDDQGHVVTNFHVVRNASGASVTLSDQSTYEARLIGISPNNDLAVLKIDAPAEKLRPLPIGSSEDLQIGQFAMAIGNPFGLDQSLTTGIISAVGRTIQSPAGVTIEQVIQTDAAVNPGNSGGPLLDSAGRLIGVNTAIASPSGASAGIGFAVPVDTVNRVVPQLVRDGRVTRGVLGVRTGTAQFNANMMRQIGQQGVLVMQVDEGSPAARAGIRGTTQDERGRILFGDIITEIEGRRIDSPNNLAGVLGLYDPGDEVRVKLLRGDARIELTITLDAERPAEGQ